MSDENVSTEGTETGEVTETTTESTETPSEITSVDQLPEFARKIISDLRSEAAKHRTAKGEAVESTKSEVAAEYETKLTESNTAHEVTKGELAKVNLSLAKLQTALDADVPADKVKDFAELLQGSTPEELKAHAEKVKNTFGGFSSAYDPSQGRGAAKSTGNADDDFTSFISNLFGN